MKANGIDDKEFRAFQSFIHDEAGIYLSDAKRHLVASRLAKRLRHYELTSYGDYFKLVEQGEHGDERQLLVDLLTTNETYFFREPRHFEFLERELLPKAPPGRRYRVWSAASSSGEEPYTLAMTLDAVLGKERWELLASDISSTVLERARQGIYPIDEAERIPLSLRNRYCLKGVRSQQGRLRVVPELRQQIDFRQLNLNGSWPDIGRFDVIFLRNVMIYFDAPTKQRLVARMRDMLQPGGYLIVSHSESLHGVAEGMEMVMPSVYCKPQRRAAA